MKNRYLIRIGTYYVKQKTSLFGTTCHYLVEDIESATIYTVLDTVKVDLRFAKSVDTLYHNCFENTKVFIEL